MGKTEKFKLPDGNSVDVEQIEISQTTENWSHYLLEDGTAIKLKPIAMKVVRFIDKYDQAGNPVYSIQSNNVVSVDCPENLKQQQK